MIDLRFPNITATTEAGQLSQMKSYLHQLVEQLNWALATVDNEIASTSQSVTVSGASSASGSTDPVTSFNDIKALIIKSADIVNAYYDEINTRLGGVYVAQDDFGTFVNKTTADIEANSSSITGYYTNLQQVITSVGNLEHTLSEVNARIKTGLLEDGDVPIYGVEVGQRTVIDGVESFNKYARFTSDRLSFYDNNNNEVAYVSDRKLYITTVEITGSLAIGNFVDTVLADGSIVTKWLG